MARNLTACVMAFTVTMLCASPLRAQVVDVPNVWSHGTRLAACAGVSSASSNTGVAVGPAIAWEITPRLSIEGIALWLDRQDAAVTFAAALMAEVNLAPPYRVGPFVEAGFGLYRSSFDARRETMPSFYRDRMTAGPGAVFTDPAFVLGGGVNLFAARHVAVRPQVDVFIVATDSRKYPVYTASVQVAYHFENQPMTPRR